MAEGLDLKVPRGLGDARLDRVLEELVPGVSRARPRGASSPRTRTSSSSTSPPAS